MTSKLVNTYKELPRKSVDIKKAQNGFVISSWSPEGEQCMIAKTKAEANLAAKKILGL